MRFAVSLLTILSIASVIGTVLKQNEPYQNYVIKFGQFWFEMFEMLGLYDVYHASWFLLILLFLVISTSLCVYRNAPLMLKEWRTYKEQATEKSLRAFSHQASFSASGKQAPAESTLAEYLQGQGYRFKRQALDNGDVLLAAKAGTHQRWGYIFTHAAIVIICLGGLMDGNLVFKVQELLGIKKIETLDIPVSKVPAVSRLSVSNPSFRANMTIPEGEQGSVAFVRIKDGYLVQELPFKVTLKDFRIEHYATGQPKSFESDILIHDPAVAEPIATTISVNHPFIYKGIAIYQSDFQDGGSKLHFKLWDLMAAKLNTFDIDGVVDSRGLLGEGNTQLKVEFNEFRKFNIINLAPDGKGKPKNVGPNITFKLRDITGQAKEFVNYMQPLNIDGKAYFVSGVRETVQEEFKYLRMPADDNLEIDGFMHWRNLMRDPAMMPVIAKRVAAEMPASDAALKQKFEKSVTQLLMAFAKGGYTTLSQVIETAVPKAQREEAAQAYLKLLNAAAFEAYQLSLSQRGIKPAKETNELGIFIQDSLNAMNDTFFYGTPYYFQLTDFQHKQASGLQLTKSPGQFWVYLGSVLLVLGVFAMFYIRERRIWLLIKPKEVLFAMTSNRKNLDFDQAFEQTKQQLAQII